MVLPLDNVYGITPTHASCGTVSFVAPLLVMTNDVLVIGNEVDDPVPKHEVGAISTTMVNVQTMFMGSLRRSTPRDDK